MAGKKRIVRAYEEIELTFASKFQDFILQKKAGNLSQSSIEAYQSNLKPFFRFLESRGIKNISGFGERAFMGFKLWLQDLNIRPVSVNTYLRHTRVFLYYLMKEKLIERFDITLNKQEEVVKETYSDTDIQKLLVPPKSKGQNFGEYRNWLMVNFFLETGVRLKSALNIKVKDLDLMDKLVRITTTKNRRQQELPIEATTASHIRKYLSMYGFNGESYLFPNQAGEQLSEDSAKHAIARYNRQRDVKITSIHAFRHTFARNYILTNGDSLVLKNHLGHSNMAMTDHYVSLFGVDLQRDFESHSIIERLSKKRVQMQPKPERINRSAQHV